jgi:hypothetical protein
VNLEALSDEEIEGLLGDKVTLGNPSEPQNAVR